MTNLSARLGRVVEGPEVGKSCRRIMRRRRVRVCRSSRRPGNKPGRALESRSGLVANQGLTGAAFPCLKVDVSHGDERGYVLLRAPWGAPDLVLAPTRKIAGVEDPSLQNSGAAKLFRGGSGTRAPFCQRSAKSRSRVTTWFLRRQSTIVAEPGPASHPYRVPSSAHETEASNPRAGAAGRRMGSYSRTHQGCKRAVRTGTMGASNR